MHSVFARGTFFPEEKYSLSVGKLRFGHSSEPLKSALMFNKKEKKDVAFEKRIKKIRIPVLTKEHYFMHFTTHCPECKEDPLH